jgi:hypothetical protein
MFSLAHIPICKIEVELGNIKVCIEKLETVRAKDIDIDMNIPIHQPGGQTAASRVDLILNTGLVGVMILTAVQCVSQSYEIGSQDLPHYYSAL